MSAPKAARWSALDVFRGIAVVSMIQGHTFTALVPKSEFTGGWSRLYTLIHGLTAPMFLLGGGLAYGMVSARRQARAGKLVLDTRIVRRAAILLLVGYALQHPHVATWRMVQRPEYIARTFAVGPLQLVAGCLLLCELLRLAARTTRAYQLCLIALIALVGGVSPWVWQAHLSEQLWPIVGMWFDAYRYSQFPFFPWSVFFFAGVLGSYLVPFDKRNEWPRALGFLGGGAACAWGIYALYQAGERMNGIYGEHDFWRAGPMYVGFRLALVFAWLGVLMLAEPLIARLRGYFPTGFALFDVLARQSLVAYVVHLLFLYGSPLTAGVVRFGRVFDLLEATFIFLGIGVFTLAVCVLWDHYITSRALKAALSKQRARLQRLWAARRGPQPVASEVEEPASEEASLEPSSVREVGA
jgi:hypothetical protein